ncbi:GMP synthase domain protein, partial [Ostertagia ostertagi]
MVATFNQLTKGHEDERWGLQEQYAALKTKIERLEERFIEEEYTQLIARSIRELHVYCEIQPCTKPVNYEDNLKVNDANAPKPDIKAMADKLPVLGVCYGAQLIAQQAGAEVGRSTHREYGRAHLQGNAQDPLLTTISEGSQVWMSHSDSVKELPQGFSLIARTESIPVAAYKAGPDFAANAVYGIQFHPEVTHSTDGRQLLKNFVVDICGTKQDWTPAAFVAETVARIKEQVGDQKVVMALSGGVDSTVAATLVHRAIGENLYCIFVDNGLLRKNEFEQVMEGYKHLGLNTKGINARQRFYDGLDGVSDPEKKRKIIGGLFIDIFQEEANLLTGVSFLGQGTIYPDVIESLSVHGPSATIKSHHNGDVSEGFMMLTAGDTASFRVSADSMQKVGMMLPEWVEKGKNVKIQFDVKVVNVQTQAEMQAEAQTKAAAQIGIDDKLLQDYFAKNNIKATKTASGLYYKIDKPGSGPTAAAGQSVTMEYTGKTMDGTKFDSNVDPQFQHVQPFTFVLGQGQVIRGWDEGIALMNKGAKGTLYIPSPMAYGAQSPSPAIPANSVLIFDVEVKDIAASAPQGK